jgi:signal transduction histidine kinase
MIVDETTYPRTDVVRAWLKPIDQAYIARVGMLASAYVVTAKLGLLMDAVSGFATTVWPPTGICLAALYLFGFRLWPGVALGAFLVNITAGAPFLAACGMAAGNTLEALVGVWLLRRFAGSRGLLDRISGVVAFVLLASGISTMVSATIGVTSGWLGGVIASSRLGEAWLTWWLGDALGNLVVAPLFLVWAERPRVAWPASRIAEAFTLLASLAIISLLIFGPMFTSDQAIFLQPYVLLPFLIWATLRFGSHGTVSATLVVAILAIWRTSDGFGPFARGTLNESLLLLQAFMGVVAVTMLIFAAGVSERRRAETRIRVNYSVARVLAEAPSLEGVTSRILEAICESLHWDCGNLWIVDPYTETLHHAAEWHRPLGRLEQFRRAAAGMTFKPGVGMAGRVWSEGRPIWVPNLATDPDFIRAPMASSLGLRAAMGVPISAGREVYGVMSFFASRVQPPDETLLPMMATLGSQIGQFIERRRAEEDLRQAHAGLEMKVARRTEQLSLMNRALQDEIAERRQAEDSLRLLSTRLLRVQDEERQRLARDLHDSTAQSLAGLSMNLAVAQERREALDNRTRTALDESEALAQHCSREIRSLSYLLHPPLLTEVGLVAAVRWCADGFAQRSGIAIELDLSEGFGRLPADVENALFRIVQECLANVQRHSGSPTAHIRMHRQGRRVTLEVRDEGRGMPPGLTSRGDAVESLGVGLLGMRERVRQLGGRFEIDSGPGGATIRVLIAITRDGA